MNQPQAVRKDIRRFLAILPGLALFLSLFAPASVSEALAQYIPPPASQNFAPTQPAAKAAPEATTRRSTTTRTRKKTSEAVAEEAPAEPRKARTSARKSRAEARAEARKARAEAQAEARAEARAAAAKKAEKRTASARKKSRVAAVAEEEEEEVEEAPVAQQASNKLTILAGQPQTTIARGADEMVDVIKSAGLDIEAKTGPISMSQLTESAGGEVAILQSDALDDARREGGPTLQRKLTFIARLFNQEIHIIARPGVKNFADLNGRAVAASAPDTPEGRTASKLFERAGLRPRLLDMPPATALSRLGRGEIDAAIFVGGKPVPALAENAIAGLKLISIPYKGALQDSYYPAQIEKSDYPGLVANDNGVDTVAIGTVLVALDAKPGSPAYKKLTQFTQIFFERFSALRDGAHHPKWREVNLAADVPGWRRFQPAQKWLDNAPAPRASSMK